jgi:hypothetical protein
VLGASLDLKKAASKILAFFTGHIERCGQLSQCGEEKPMPACFLFLTFAGACPLGPAKTYPFSDN